MLSIHRKIKHFLAFKSPSYKFVICGGQSPGTTSILILGNKISRAHMQSKHAEKSTIEHGPGSRLAKQTWLFEIPRRLLSRQAHALSSLPPCIKYTTRLIPSTHLASDLIEKSFKSLLKMCIFYRNSIKSKLN